MLENGCRSVFLELDKIENTKNELSEGSIQFVKEVIMKFIDSKFALYRWDEVENVCRAAVHLFPCIHIVSCSDKKICVVILTLFHCQDELCNAKAKKGSIYHKIHHKMYRVKPRNEKNKKNAKNNADNLETSYENGNLIEQNNDVDELEFLLYFKTCLVDRDMDILKIRLGQSIEMRESLIKKKDTQFHKIFPFYFIKPTLVREFCQIEKKKHSNALL